MKFRIHPLCFVALFAYTLVGGLRGYLVAFLAVLIHESSHASVARFAGAEDLAITLTPYGAMMTSTGEIPRFGAVLVAGPLSNLLVASVALSVCWLLPELYGTLKGFLRANVLIASVNLLPAYPLDGGRLLRLLVPVKGVRIVTSVGTLAVAVLALLSFALTRNLALLLFGGFMLSYFFAFCLPRVTRCETDEPLYTLARTDEEGRLRPAVVREKGKVVRRLSPREITSLCLTYPTDTPIGRALEGGDLTARYK